MNRDSRTTSLWQDSKLPVHPSRKAAATSFDVIIIGGGITGITTALMLQQAGKSCLLLEAHNIGFGTTSGTTAHLNTVLDTPYSDIAGNFGKKGAVLTAKAARKAINIIRDNITQFAIDCDFTTCNGYMYAADEKEAEQLKKMADAAEKAGIETRSTTSFPGPMPYKEAVCFPEQACFNPLKYLSALTEAFIAAGGTIQEQAQVNKTEESGSILLVYTDSQTYSAGHVVHATHTPMGINIMTFRLAPYRSYVIAARLEDENLYPDDLIYDLQDPYHYYRTAIGEDGKKVLIAGGSDHKTGQAENTEAVFRELEAYVRNFYPVKEVAYRWSSQYYEPADGLPYIGHFPGGGTQEYVATGFSGNGMIFGTLSGKIISDLIIKGESQYADLFAPSRIKPVAGFKNFIRENANVIKHFITDRLSIQEIEELAALAGNEGAIVQYQESRIALYKDINGRISALDPACRHAGCIVQWNNSEQSWDCPCHGARYGTDGTVLNGPATDPLKEIKIE